MVGAAAWVRKANGFVSDARVAVSGVGTKPVLVPGVMEAIIGTELNGALAGLKSAEDAVASAASQIRGLMAGAGYPTAQ